MGGALPVAGAPRPPLGAALAVAGLAASGVCGALSLPAVPALPVVLRAAAVVFGAALLLSEDVVALPAAPVLGLSDPDCAVSSAAAAPFPLPVVLRAKTNPS